MWGRIWEWECDKIVDFVTPTKHTPWSPRQKLASLMSLLPQSSPAVPQLGSAPPTAKCSTSSSPPLCCKVKSQFLCQVSLPTLTPKWFLSSVSDTLKNKMYLVWYQKQRENDKGPEITRNVKVTGPKNSCIRMAESYKLVVKAKQYSLHVSKSISNIKCFCLFFSSSHLHGLNANVCFNSFLQDLSTVD